MTDERRDLPTPHPAGLEGGRAPDGRGAAVVGLPAAAVAGDPTRDVPRPVSRRELRERERSGRTAPRRGSGAAPASMPATGAPGPGLAGVAGTSAVVPDQRASGSATPSTVVSARSDASAHPGGHPGVAPATARVPGSAPDAAPEMPHDRDDVDHRSHGYTVKHYLALALLAGILGFLTWSHTTGPAASGATSGTRSATISPSGSPAAHQGEL